MNGPDFARLDAEDPLAALHEHFDLPPDTVYLDGNSLGALPRNVAARMERTVRHEWGADLVAGDGQGVQVHVFLLRQGEPFVGEGNGLGTVQRPVDDPLGVDPAGLEGFPE